MLTVQFAGPQNLCSCPEWGGAPEGAEPLLEWPGVQRCRKCERSPLPYSAHGQAYFGLIPGCRLPKVASLKPAPGAWKKEPGENQDLVEQDDRTELSDQPLFLRVLDPSFRILLPSGHFTEPGQTPGRAPGPPGRRQSFLLGPLLSCPQ